MGGGGWRSNPSYTFFSKGVLKMLFWECSVVLSHFKPCFLHLSGAALFFPPFNGARGVHKYVEISTLFLPFPKCYLLILDNDIICIIRSACSIQLEEMVILTGGLDYEEEPTTRVTVYNKNGFLADWPHLQTSRYDHGCGHFINADKEVVR